MLHREEGGCFSGWGFGKDDGCLLLQYYSCWSSLKLTNSWNKVSSALLWLEQGGEKARPPPAPGTARGSGATDGRRGCWLITHHTNKESIQRKSRKFCFNTAETDSLSQFGKFPASNISGFCLSKRCFDFNDEKRSDVDVSVRPQHNVLFALSSSWLRSSSWLLYAFSWPSQGQNRN